MKYRYAPAVQKIILDMMGNILHSPKTQAILNNIDAKLEAGKDITADLRAVIESGELGRTAGAMAEMGKGFGEFGKGIVEADIGGKTKEIAETARTVRGGLGAAQETARELGALAKGLKEYSPYMAGGAITGAAALGLPALYRRLTAKKDEELGWLAKNPLLALSLGGAFGSLAGAGLKRFGMPKTSAYKLGHALALNQEDNHEHNQRSA